MKTLPEFIQEHGITIRSRRVDSNPYADDEEWSRGASHWRVTLRRGTERLHTYFSMGAAHTGEPDIAGVLSCLISDAEAVDYSFEEWCSNLGYDSDSKKAERIYKLCERNGKKLREFLGGELWDELANVEPY